MGLGELGLQPSELWALTPHEFLLKVRGFYRAENRAVWLVAKLALITTEYKKKFRSPDHLLGYSRAMERYPTRETEPDADVGED